MMSIHSAIVAFNENSIRNHLAANPHVRKLYVTCIETTPELLIEHENQLTELHINHLQGNLTVNACEELVTIRISCGEVQGIHMMISKMDNLTNLVLSEAKQQGVSSDSRSKRKVKRFRKC